MEDRTRLWSEPWRALTEAEGRAVLVESRWRAWELATKAVDQTTTEFVNQVVPAHCRRAWWVWTEKERLADPRLAHFFDALHRERCILRGEPEPPLGLEALMAFAEQARQDHAALVVETWRCHNLATTRPRYARRAPREAIAQAARAVCRAHHDRADLAAFMVIAAREHPDLRETLSRPARTDLRDRFRLLRAG